MKLLIITQKVDRNDPVLGFFHGWLAEFSRRFESLAVICLEEGAHDLPANVRVLSLGKEKGASRSAYIKGFYSYIWNERAQYDAVFMHMNQEYVLLGGLLWRLWGKKILMWRNHRQGGMLTRLAVLMSDKVFATSSESFTAKYGKTAIMPVGIDTDLFAPTAGSAADPGLILSLGRISPVKSIDLIVRAFQLVRQAGVPAKLRIVGDAPARDAAYAERLRGLITDSNYSSDVAWLPGVTPAETSANYQKAGVFVNATPSGSFDKTMFEAMACGTTIITSNLSVRGKIDELLTFTEGDAESLASSLKAVLALSQDERSQIAADLRTYVLREHSLSALSSKLAAACADAPRKSFFARYIALRYLLSGGTGAFVQLSCLYLLTSILGIWYLASGVIAFLIAAVVGFMMQKLWTFRDHSSHRTGMAFAGYMAIGIFNLAANTALLYAFTGMAHIPYLASQAMASILVAVWSFFLYKVLVFKS